MESRFVRFKYLFERYTSNNFFSVDEKNEFLEKVTHDEYAPLLKELIKDKVENTVEDRIMEKEKADEIFNTIIQVAKENDIVYMLPEKKRNTKWWWAAASVLIILTVGSYFFLKQPATKSVVASKSKVTPLVNDALPGKQGAILTLANGKTIVLDSAHNGLLTNQGNTQIVKENGKVSYQGEKNSGNEIMYNTMTTPKGRQYQLILADGSKVWLNAASSITYPTAFTGKERRVSITGEAYFEIKHISFNSTTGEEAIPFFVDYNSSPNEKGEIKVMGTHFNVMDYNNEAAVKTTLLEGSVKVTENNKTVTIKPGEQAVMNKEKNTVSVVKADVDEAVAWKNGFFSFKSATIETVMRQVERWYDVDVVYNGAKPEGHYRGEVPMNVNASVMLKVLEVSGIHFKIDGKRIVVEN
ncbi:MAG TPA: FecR domain-containing protein [Hanamia sp.]|nr:FecR domain-containing protein [Hanamia sp.]